MSDSTRSASIARPRQGSSERTILPGLLVLFEQGKAALRHLPLVDSELVIGRTAPNGKLEDEAVSRRHARIRYDGFAWSIEDLESRNGTFVDGARIESLRTQTPRLIRVGGTLLVPSRDVFAHEYDHLARTDAPVVLGAALAKTWKRIAKLSAGSRVLHLRGESGSGKELAAKHFHDSASSAASAPFVVINCATIPSALAERVLFGAKRGAYTGADANSTGLLKEAHGGTLFLDEIAELDLSVQAKLLRVAENGEVLPLGAERADTVDVRICSATHVDLDDAVRKGTFRADLRFRLGSPAVRIPPLRERIDEIPWHLEHELRAQDNALRAHHSFVEACLLRRWRGNVRELRGVVRRAAIEAAMRGSDTIQLCDLEPTECNRVVKSDVNALEDREHVESTLRRHRWNVTQSAKALGVHRNQLRRAIEKLLIEIPKSDG